MKNKSQSPYESFMWEYREFERRIEKAIALKDPRRQHTKEHLLKTNEIYSVTSIFKTDCTITSRLKNIDLRRLGRPPPIFSQILITRI